MSKDVKEVRELLPMRMPVERTFQAERSEYICSEAVFLVSSRYMRSTVARVGRGERSGSRWKARK